MKLTQHVETSGYAIRAYQPGEVLINDERHHTSVIVAPDRLITGWAPQRLEELRAEDLEPLLALAPTIVLIGTGPTLRFPEPAVLAPLHERGIGVEVMDTGAACRTYAVLMSEDRQVAAALLLA